VSAFVDGLSWALLITGSLFVVTGGIGLVRMPDFFTRLHPAGLVDTMGATLVTAGLLLQAGPTQVSIKLILVLVFVYFTSPTATHAVAHAALVSGLKPWTGNEEKEADQ
jgi:multicomponent Na+:H+ antiporter subunit G